MNAAAGFRPSGARLALAYGAASAVLIGALLGAVYLLTRNVLQREFDRIVAEEVQDLRDDFDSGGIDGLRAALQRREDGWGRLGAVYLLADASLVRVAGNLTAWPDDARPAPGARLHFRIDADARGGVDSHPVDARCEPLPGGYWLLVGTDTSDREATLRRFGIATLWGVGLTTALVLALGWRYSRRTAQRVRGFADTCDSIMRGDLSQRLVVGSRQDEFDALGASVNTMLDRLERQAETLRTTLGSVAHDLRTPLYRLRMRLEEQLLPGGSREASERLAPAIRELDRVQHTLGVLLEIARAQSGAAAAAQERVDLSQLVGELGELYAPGFQEQGIHFEEQPGSGLLVAGNRQLLAQLIANLLENALRHVPRDGHVRLAAQRSDGDIELSVRDDGPGIPAADRERALQPFVRLHDDSGASGGSGLGLSLVAAIARLHGARLELRENRPGLAVLCRFAPAPPAPAIHGQERTRPGVG